MYVERLIINCGQITYFVIVVAGYVALAYGIKHVNTDYIHLYGFISFV